MLHLHCCFQDIDCQIQTYHCCCFPKVTCNEISKGSEPYNYHKTTALKSL